MPLREYVAQMNASTEYVFSRLANPDSLALREDFQLDDIVEGALDPTEFFIVRTSNCCRHLCSYLEVLLLCMYSALLWLCFLALLWPCFALAGPARGRACCSRAVGGVDWERRGRI